MRRLRGHFTYANVMATIAVFIALGGVSYAATRVPKNSVGTAQLRNGAVTGSKIQNVSITRSKLDLQRLGAVPAAEHAESAGSATRADTASSATHADTARYAETANFSSQAGNAEDLGGLEAGRYGTYFFAHTELPATSTDVTRWVAVSGVSEPVAKESEARISLPYWPTGLNWEAEGFSVLFSAKTDEYGSVRISLMVNTAESDLVCGGFDQTESYCYNPSGTASVGHGAWLAYRIVEEPKEGETIPADTVEPSFHLIPLS